MSGDVDGENLSKAETTENSDMTSAWLLNQIPIYGAAVGYCISASLLTIINKWAVMRFPYPGVLTALQYFTSVVVVLLCGALNLMDQDPLDHRTMCRFLPAAAVFYLSLYTNSELLLHANVDTFIVFRSAVPITVAIGETLFLHRPWPSFRTWSSLAAIFAGGVLYVATDRDFTFGAYAWAVAYVVTMTVDFVYIKHVVMTIGLSTWGLVLYNNLEALLLFPIEMVVTDELRRIRLDDSLPWNSVRVLFPVVTSCVFGLAISFFGFSCRRDISATGYTVLGVVNKILTVVINLLVWDRHSNFPGTVGLFICVVGGIMYQQSTTVKVVARQSGQDGDQENLVELPVGRNASDRCGESFESDDANCSDPQV